LFHLLFLFPFMRDFFKKENLPENKSTLKCLLLYLSATLFSSIILWYAHLFGIYSLSISFLFLFGAGAFLPACFKLTYVAPIEKKEPHESSFLSFCTEFGISKREAEIILEICSGKSNKAIADKLFITLQTVKDHTHRIY